MTLFDPYLDRLRPVVQRTGIQAAAYAERIIALLDQIRHNTEDVDPFGSYRHISLALGPGFTDPNIQIPPGEIWELTTVVISTPAGNVATRVQLVDGGDGAGGGLVKWASLQNGDATYPGNGLVLRPGTKITFNNPSTNTASVYFQFLRRIPRPVYHTTNSGQIQVGPDDIASAQEQENVTRHTTSLKQVNNVIGERVI